MKGQKVEINVWTVGAIIGVLVLYLSIRIARFIARVRAEVQVELETDQCRNVLDTADRQEEFDRIGKLADMQIPLDQSVRRFIVRHAAICDACALELALKGWNPSEWNTRRNSTSKRRKWAR